MTDHEFTQRLSECVKDLSDLPRDPDFAAILVSIVEALALTIIMRGTDHPAKACALAADAVRLAAERDGIADEATAALTEWLDRAKAARA